MGGVTRSSVRCEPVVVVRGGDSGGSGAGGGSSFLGTVEQRDTCLTLSVCD